MTVDKARKLPFAVAGLSTLIGRVLTIAEWAEAAKIPQRGGGVMTGELVERILGISGKSWDPWTFADLGRIAAVAREALLSADLEPRDIDALIVVTCSPYEVMLDQDAFRLAREIELADSVVPVQIGAGCAGLARAAALAGQLAAENVLVVTYNAPSRVTGDLNGGVNQLYLENDRHPLGRSLWASAGIFSDGAAALVLSRQSNGPGLVLYSRDSLAFGDEPGFTDPLIHHFGGGARHPMGTPDAQELACYGMNGPMVKRYYTQGMMLNHAALEAALPNYVDRVRRIYTHQASPALVSAFARLAGLPEDKAPTNARRFGNLVSASTAKMLHDDLYAGEVTNDDLICVSVVGSGPERGAYVLPLRIAKIVEPGTAPA
ncbi:3-oxoacyl-[acyl-carrier-protein] synthase III C-terminal domain-containing protein [Actinoplanes friuliensis]|uniref:Putative beta-ketoacyl-acyl carrier protein synthase n=1 Tax=Actinoplanes friuliensis DSM 7358 TaxID=1246995 RepID=U5VQA1_9ACTN|nr:3-oxoacyl-[acyl-carrier-protein] synthase III C-terminal domain-containing protein [Actinoplanes friuliensis]AGZ38992.1 putative beta-ketoacyl-acyl carrier protein synthase [Actinoplanes friuliensis DSM 7358]